MKQPCAVCSGCLFSQERPTTIRQSVIIGVGVIGTQGQFTIVSLVCCVSRLEDAKCVLLVSGAALLCLALTLALTFALTLALTLARVVPPLQSNLHCCCCCCCAAWRLRVQLRAKLRIAWFGCSLRSVLKSCFNCVDVIDHCRGEYHATWTLLG